MPCNEITERLWLRLDHEDRIVDYRLTKNSCGRGVGDSRFLERLLNRSLDELLALPLDKIPDTMPVTSGAERFFYLKHLSIIKLALAVIAGQIEGTAESGFAVESITRDEAGIEMVALMKSNLPTDNIRSCFELKPGRIRDRSMDLL